MDGDAPASCEIAGEPCCECWKEDLGLIYKEACVEKMLVVVILFQLRWTSLQGHILITNPGIDRLLQKLRLFPFPTVKPEGKDLSPLFLKHPSSKFLIVDKLLDHVAVRHNLQD